MNEKNSIFSLAYWKSAALELKRPKMLVLASVLIALRVAIKSWAIPIGENLFIYFGFFVNALGGMCFGPVVAAVAAAISDTLGCLIAPKGVYFFPFIFVEIAGSVIFALFLYKRRISEIRVILSRFCVCVGVNLILNPLIMIWYYEVMFDKSYTFFTLPRTVKNLVLFPAESLLLILFLNALIPALSRFKLIVHQEKMKISVKNVLFLLALLVVAILVVYFYYTKFLVNI